MALLHLLLATLPNPSATLHVAHFDHGLRSDSAQDAHFVQEEAGRCALRCTIGQWQEKTGTGNLAARARTARYQFLLRTAERQGADCVVTGHHLDDQAETIVERLLRGSGLQGLQAMAESRSLTDQVALLRPLLPFTRAELRAWLQGQGILWREDGSNAVLIARRNRIRHQVLPTLQAVADAGLSRRLAATASRLRQVEQALDWMLTRLWPSWDPQETATGGISLAVAPLSTLPDELLYRCLQQCQQRLQEGAHPLGERAVHGFLHRLRSRRRCWRMVVHGMAIERQQDRLLFCRPEGRWQ